MALIWAKGFEGGDALAPLWRKTALAELHAQDPTLTDDAEIGRATREARDARTAYDLAVTQAEAALKQEADSGNSFTHLLVVGVGKYQNAGIPGLTTSVYGARKFTDWMLTRFLQPDRPLGSIELILSPGDGMGDWKPSSEAAGKLGLASGENAELLPSDPATFANIKRGFGKWLDRAGTRLENAAFFYFSGHGVWKSEPYILPEDASLVTNTLSNENLININQTQVSLFNAKPSIQCFFVDACQDTTLALLQNVDANPAQPLHNPSNAAKLPKRDAWRYFGSYIGMKAYGPDNDAPFFTQDLIACMERRGAARPPDNGVCKVTTSSLGDALKAAGQWRAEAETQDIEFTTATLVSSFTAELCTFPGPPEVFVQVNCDPSDVMTKGRMYIEIGGARSFRTAPRENDWFTYVGQQQFKAGVEFEAPAALESAVVDVTAYPPIVPVTLPVRSQKGGGDG